MMAEFRLQPAETMVPEFRDQPISLDKAVTLGSRGRPKRGEEKGADGTLKRGTNSAAYILARLDRDGHEELAGKRGKRKGRQSFPQRPNPFREL